MTALRALAFFLLAAPAAAEDPGWDQAGRALEMRAHAWLMQLDRSAPAPFKSDGCSGGLSAAWSMAAKALPVFARTHQEAPPFEPCCMTHDRAYHLAGTAATAEDSYAARLEADRVLRQCVLDTGEARRSELAVLYGASEAQVEAAYAALARSVYYVVRFGGGPCSGLSWRWGFGFAHCGAGD